MKKIYFLIFTFLISSASFGQGNETFDLFTETGSSYANGTFMGQDGSTWTYVQARGDQSITGKSIMLGRNRTPQAEVYSGTISGGIGTISFNYQRTFSTNINLNILVNDIVYGNVTSTDGTVQNSGTITVNQPGDVVIKFISVNNSDGQVTIDDIVWTGFTGTATPTISVTSPADGTDFPSGTTAVDVAYTTANTNAGDQVNITVNGGTPNMDVPNPFSVSTMDGQSYSVLVELVDSGATVLDSETITFNVLYPCTLTIGTITETCNSINEGTGDTYNADIEFTGGGNSTYTINTGGIGTVGGDNPSMMAAGTITISDIPENTNVTVAFTGDPANSGCDFTRFVSSPICDPQLELPFTNNFEYGTMAGDLVTLSAGDWESHSGSTTVQYTETSLVLTDYDARASFGGAAAVTPSNSQDVNLAFTEQTSGTVYMSALVNLSAVTTNGNYFWHLRGSGFTARVSAKSDGTTGANFGIGATGAITFGTTSYMLNTTYLAVASYNIDSGVSNLYILTAPTGTEPATPEATSAGDIGESVSSVALRQSSGIPNATIDGIRISKSWSNLSLSSTDFASNAFSVFPNPTSTGFVNIRTQSSSDVAVSVFDILGKQVINQTLSNERLDVSGLNAGVYIMRISQDNNTTTKKLIIK